MFDYQAGEKYRLTLIMVGLAGVMAGIFFCMLLMPQPEPQARKSRPAPKWAADPDVTGGRSARMSSGEGNTAAYAAAGAADVGLKVDRVQALEFIQKWLPLAWDLSAATATQSQEQAIAYMTPEAAQAYRQNVWTADLAGQLQASGVRSHFEAPDIKVQPLLADGSCVICVEGVQTLAVPGKGQTQRQVKLEYLLRQTADGLRIAGISEVGNGG